MDYICQVGAINLHILFPFPKFSRSKVQRKMMAINYKAILEKDVLNPCLCFLIKKQNNKKKNEKKKKGFLIFDCKFSFVCDCRVSLKFK